MRELLRGRFVIFFVKDLEVYLDVTTLGYLVFLVSFWGVARHAPPPSKTDHVVYTHVRTQQATSTRTIGRTAGATATGRRRCRWYVRWYVPPSTVMGEVCMCVCGVFPQLFTFTVPLCPRSHTHTRTPLLHPF